MDPGEENERTCGNKSELKLIVGLDTDLLAFEVSFFKKVKHYLPKKEEVSCPRS